MISQEKDEPSRRNICTTQTLKHHKFGADLILLKTLCLKRPYISGLPEKDELIKLLKKLTGIPIGVNQNLQTQR